MKMGFSRIAIILLKNFLGSEGTATTTLQLIFLCFLLVLLVSLMMIVLFRPPKKKSLIPFLIHLLLLLSFTLECELPSSDGIMQVTESNNSGVNSGWTDLIGTNPNGSSEQSINQPAASPSNPPEENAPPFERFPYDPDEVIGGDSVNSIQQRLLRRHRSPSAEVIERTKIDAQDLFEVKVEIIRTMTPLHPEGDWLRRGARALDNNRTQTGEESLEKLYNFLTNLRENGLESETFQQLKGKVFLRIDDIDSDSEIH